MKTQRINFTEKKIQGTWCFGLDRFSGMNWESLEDRGSPGSKPRTAWYLDPTFQGNAPENNRTFLRFGFEFNDWIASDLIFMIFIDQTGNYNYPPADLFTLTVNNQNVPLARNVEGGAQPVAQRFRIPRGALAQEGRNVIHLEMNRSPEIVEKMSKVRIVGALLGKPLSSGIVRLTRFSNKQDLVSPPPKGHQDKLKITFRTLDPLPNRDKAFYQDVAARGVTNDFVKSNLVFERELPNWAERSPVESFWQVLLELVGRTGEGAGTKTPPLYGEDLVEGEYDRVDISGLLEFTYTIRPLP